jgi:flagellar biosynthesis protein FlhF
MDRIRLLDEIQGLRGRLETVAGLLLSATPEDLTPESKRMHVRLLETGLDPRLSTAVLRRASKIDVPLERAVHHILSAAVRCGGPVERGLGQQVIAFVGPTGVGKTTTIAKIGAHLVLTEKRRIALVSSDGFRVAGAQQLEFYADILEVPFRVGHDRDAVAAAIASLHDAEVVLVDTTGRGGADAEGVDEIGRALGDDARVQRWLVLSAVASTMDNLSALKTFARLRPTGVVVTKLDEATSHGAVGTVLVRSGLPLRYLTDGQCVPDDLIAATRDAFPDLLLAGRAR